MTSPLALLGGEPEIAAPTPHFTWPPITEATLRAVEQQTSESLSIPSRSGVVARLEDALEDYFGVQHAVLTSSGTTSLYSTYAASGVGPGDEVIVPAYTFLATATPLLHLGAVPVLVDCDDDGNIDPRQVVKHITTRTKAVVAAHLWGRPAAVDMLRDLCDRSGLLLLEDGAHAHGAALDGRMVGTFGAAAAFSLNGPKPLSAGEGGFALTDHDEIYYRLLLHGQYNKRCRDEIPPEHELARYAVTGMGLKFRIHPLAAASALQQLPHLDEYLDGRAFVVHHLVEELCDVPGISIPPLEPGVRHSWYGFALQYDENALPGVPIARLHSALLAEGCSEIDRPGSTCPLNLHPLFQEPAGLFPHLGDVMAYAPETSLWPNAYGAALSSCRYGTARPICRS